MPAWTVRIVSINSFRTMFFSRYPYAPALKARVCLCIAGVSCQHDDASIGKLFANLHNRVDAVDLRHLHVHQRHVRVVSAKLFDPSRPLLASATRIMSCSLASTAAIPSRSTG